MRRASLATAFQLAQRRRNGARGGRKRGIANAIEEFEEFRVAVNVTLKTSSICSRKARLAGIADGNTIFEFVSFNLQRFRSIPSARNGSDVAHTRRIIILKPAGTRITVVSIFAAISMNFVS